MANLSHELRHPVNESHMICDKVWKSRCDRLVR
jgi:hypothetical protein